MAIVRVHGSSRTTADDFFFFITQFLQRGTGTPAWTPQQIDCQKQAPTTEWPNDMDWRTMHYMNATNIYPMPAGNCGSHADVIIEDPAGMEYHDGNGSGNCNPDADV